jgi:hypothetical protein
LDFGFVLPNTLSSALPLFSPLFIHKFSTPPPHPSPLLSFTQPRKKAAIPRFISDISTYTILNVGKMKSGYDDDELSISSFFIIYYRAAI